MGAEDNKNKDSGSPDRRGARSCDLRSPSLKQNFPQLTGGSDQNIREQNQNKSFIKD